MEIFKDSYETLDGLASISAKPGSPAPPERLTKPYQARDIYERFARDDANSSFNRSLVQQQMNFTPPHDDVELENKGQGDRFNITTGEGPVIKNMAVGAYMDVYTTPKNLAEIPLNSSVDETMRSTWSNILAEEYSEMDRSDEGALMRHLLLADKYVTQGVVIGYFDDKDSMKVSSAGLDHFKFAKDNGIVSGESQIVVATGLMSLTDLWRKIEDAPADGEINNWNETAVRAAIVNCASHVERKDWKSWEIVERHLKSNDLYISTMANKIEVIYVWIKEFNGSYSFYITTRSPGKEGANQEEEQFLYRERNAYETADQTFQIFAFSVGDGGMLYTVRGMGYLIYQMCNAMDIIHCKLLDNARIASSLILQASNTEDMQDLQIIDAGSFTVIPPTAKVIERPMAQNLNNSLMPALQATRDILNRATGGLASEAMMPGESSGRENKTETSAKLDFLNKLNSFAINLFYGPYNNITREKILRAFTRPQRDAVTAKRITEMRQRIRDRGVPDEVIKEIDWPRVRATRVIGTGSRSSRLMLMEQVGQRYATWPAAGQKAFDYDILVELIGAEKADRYCGMPNEKKLTYDDSIAVIENFQMLEGNYITPQDGQHHMVHLGHHVEELEIGLQGIDQGQVDLAAWTTENIQLYKHCVATLQMTTVHKTLQPQLNAFRQRVQQIGEIADNGLKMLEKLARNEDQQSTAGQTNPDGTPIKQQPGAAGPGTDGAGGGQEDPKASAQKADLNYKRQRMNLDIQNQVEVGLAKLKAMKDASQQKLAITAAESMSSIRRADAEAQAKLDRAEATQV